MKSRTLFIYMITFFSVFILYNACGQQTSGWREPIEKVDGVTIVRNSIEPLNPELHITFEEDLTIGAEVGDDNYMFGSQVFMNTDDEGNIYLNDVGNQRISFLKKDGTYIRGIKTPTVFQRVAMNSQGFYIAMSADNVELGKSKKWDYFYGLFDDNFNLIAEFLRLPQEANAQYKNPDSLIHLLADSLSREAFAPLVSYVLDKNDSIYFGYPKKYEIRVYSPDGKLEKITQRDFKPVEVSEKHKEYFIQNLSEPFLAKIPAQEEKKVFELVKYPKYKPAYERFFLMENGWIFVAVDSMGDGSKLVDIFNEDGEYLTQFETDIPTDGLSFDNGKAYTIATINDYKFIKRYNYEILGSSDD